MGNFGETERRVLGLMRQGEHFLLDGKTYVIELSGKPTCHKGEPKTDIYILAKSDTDQREIKISYKKKNADFIENKMSAERARQLLGEGWEAMIAEATASIREKFEGRKLIYKEKEGKSGKGAITLGWKFELLNKLSGALSGKINLTRQQVLDVYAGNNLSGEKRNAAVCSNVIPDSGIANYLLMDEDIKSAQEVIDKMVPIERYTEQHPDVYFACKALNYRSFEKKWDGDRPLSVYVDWSADDGKLVSKLIYEKPLQKKGNEAARALMTAMSQLKMETTDDIGEGGKNGRDSGQIQKAEIRKTTGRKRSMAVILQERGRGKYRPAPDCKIEEVRALLEQKIEEEKETFASGNSEIDFGKLKYEKKKWNVLSLFSGCGGLDLGFEFAGLEAVMGKEVAEAAFRDRTVFQEQIPNNVFHTIYVNDIFDEARETYEQNAGKYLYIDKSDIRKIKEFPAADLVLGGFPCPGFSEAGPRLVDDKRNFLYLHFIRCLMQSQPKIFVAENVKGMMTLGKGEVFRQIVQDFEAAGYTVYPALLNAAEYGVPQLRERVVLVGVRTEEKFEYPRLSPTHGDPRSGLKKIVTLRDAIQDLESDPGDYFTGSYSSIFMSRNRKKEWDEPSFTIQASGRQAPIHPAGQPMQHVGKDQYIFPDGEENNRRLSVKEIARIQTFPDWYEFSRGKSTKRNENAKLHLVYKQIGNAVPVRLAWAVAQPIAEFAKRELEKREQEKRGEQRKDRTADED